MKILVLNCGSSSIKYQVIDMKSADDYTLLVKGIVERIGLSDAILTHKPTGKSKYEIVKSIPDHTSGSVQTDYHRSFLRSRLYFQSPCRLHDLGFIAEGLKFSGNIFIDKQVFQLIIGTMRQFCRKQCVQVIPYCDTQNVTFRRMLHLIYIPLRDM